MREDNTSEIFLWKINGEVHISRELFYTHSYKTNTYFFFFPFKLIQLWFSGNHMSPNKQDCTALIEMII